MKLLIASDIHGSAFYCAKLINIYKAENADRLLLLGDILYHGPKNNLPKDHSPKEVIYMLNKLKNNILCVRGNCDTEVDQSVLDFPCLADYAILEINDRIIYASHGHIYNEFNPPPLNNGDILINGHTHIPQCTNHKNYIYMNPGSISLPRQNSYNGYILLDGDTFFWKTIDGEIKNKFT